MAINAAELALSLSTANLPFAMLMPSLSIVNMSDYRQELTALSYPAGVNTMLFENRLVEFVFYTSHN